MICELLILGMTLFIGYSYLRYEYSQDNSYTQPPSLHFDYELHQIIEETEEEEEENKSIDDTLDNKSYEMVDIKL